MLPWIELHTITIGPLVIQVWGLLVAIGVLTSTWWLTKQDIKILTQDEIINIIFYAIINGVIGARLVHVIFYEPSFFINNIIEIIKIWNGGLSSFGGIIGGTITILYFLHKHNIKKQNIHDLINLFAKTTLIGWVFGRIGCFLIHDHLGAVCDIGCPLHNVSFRTPGGESRLDMAFLELVLLAPLVYISFFSKIKNHKNIAAIIGLSYGIIRFALDFLRATDIVNADVRYLGLTPGQYFAMFLIVVSSYVLLKKKSG